MVKTRRGLANLTDEQACAIKRALKAGKNITQSMLAEQYGQSQASISDIHTGKTYKHVQC